MIKREDIYKIIDGERHYQDKKWGGKDHDSKHDLEDFIEYMRKHLVFASEYDAKAEQSKSLDELRKVVALGIAAFEVFGVPRRDLNK